MQNLVADSHTVCAHAGGPTNFGACSGPVRLDGGVLTAWKHATLPACVTIRNLVVVGQAVWSWVGPNNFGDVGTPAPWDGGVADP